MSESEFVQQTSSFCAIFEIMYTGVISHNLFHKKPNEFRSERKSRGFQSRICRNLLLQVRDCMSKVRKLKNPYHTATTYSKNATADFRNWCQTLKVEKSVTTASCPRSSPCGGNSSGVLSTSPWEFLRTVSVFHSSSHFGSSRILLR